MDWQTPKALFVMLCKCASLANPQKAFPLSFALCWPELSQARHRKDHFLRPKVFLPDLPAPIPSQVTCRPLDLKLLGESPFQRLMHEPSFNISVASQRGCACGHLSLLCWTWPGLWLQCFFWDGLTAPWDCLVNCFIIARSLIMHSSRFLFVLHNLIPYMQSHLTLCLPQTQIIHLKIIFSKNFVWDSS